MELLPDPGSKALAAAVAGAAGGVVRWLTLREPLWPNSIANVAVGCLSAIYLAPVAAPLLEKILGEIDGGEDLGAFLIGLGGMTVSNMVITAWSIRRKQLEAKNETSD